MGIVHQAPAFGYSEILDSLSDSADNCFGVVGIHNLSTTAETFKVNYIRRTDAEIGTLEIPAGGFVFAPVRRVRTTGTTATAAETELLYPA